MFYESPHFRIDRMNRRQIRRWAALPLTGSLDRRAMVAAARAELARAR